MKRIFSLSMFLIFMLAACSSAALPPDGTTISWDKAVDLLRGGYVTMVAELHSGEVRLTLTNGAEVSTIGPYSGAIFDEAQACGAPCEGITLAIE